MRGWSDRGATSTEYAMIAAWIGVAIVLGVTFFGRTVVDLFQAGLDGFPP